MTLLLENFPPEILAVITGYLCSSDISLLVSECGCHNLARRLTQGGVAHLTLPPTWAANRSILLLSKLAGLQSVSIEASRDLSLVKRILSVLPPTLHHLEVKVRAVFGLLVSDELETDPALGAFSSSGYRCWNVSAAFPHLLTLIMRDTQIEDEDDQYGEPERDLIAPLAKQRFLTLLPPSLSDLSIYKMESWNIEGGIMPHLPPYLTRIGNRLKLVPSAANVSESLAASLRSLDLDLTVKAQNKRLFAGFGFENDEEEEGESDEEEEENVDRTAPNPIHVLEFPPNLTHLRMKGAGFLKLGTPAALPSTLVSLNFNATSLDLPLLINALPRSLVNLWVRAKCIFDEDSSAELRPDLEHFHLETSFDNAISMPEFSAYEMILSSFSNLKSCCLELENAARGLQENHLELLNPGLLHSLTAPLSHASAKIASKKFPLLRTLGVVHVESHSTPVEFASLPPLLTSLRLPNSASPSLHQLSSLPKSVTLLKVAFEVDSEDATFLRQNIHFTRSGASRSSASMDIDASDMTRFEFAENYGVVRSSRSSSVDLYPVPSEGTSIIGGLSLTVISFAAILPKTLTDLRFGFEIDDGETWKFLRASTLPNLRKLVFHQSLPRNLDIGGLTSLQSLRVGAITSSCISTCPPNLTSLKARNELMLPASFRPLPKSMLKIRCSLSLQPVLEALAAVPNLTSFESHGLQNLRNIDDILQKCPPTLTRFGFPAPREDAAWLSTLPQRFPKLAEVVLSKHCLLSMAVLDRLHSLGVTITGGCLTNIGSVSLLIKRAGGPRFMRPDDSIDTFLCLAVAKAFPRFKNAKESQLDWGQELASEWHAFAACLHPDTTRLAITKCDTLPNDFLRHVPKGLTCLELNSIRDNSDFYDSIGSFTSLTKLSFYDTDGVWRFQDLPHSLTELKAFSNGPNVMVTAARLQHLPPSVRSLFLYTEIDSPALAALPPSVTALTFTRQPLDAIFLAALPHTVKILRAHCPFAMLENTREVLAKRGLISFGPPITYY